MTRVINLALLVALLIVIPLSHTAMSKKKKTTKKTAKVEICHLQPYIGPFYPYPQVPLGIVIRVSRQAAQTHISKHGDCTDFVRLDSGKACRCLTCEERCGDAYNDCLAAGNDEAECARRQAICLENCLGDS